MLQVTTDELIGEWEAKILLSVTLISKHFFEFDVHGGQCACANVTLTQPTS